MLCWLLVFFVGKSWGAERNLLNLTKAKESVISGILNPASLSYNGNEIVQSRDWFSGLLLNGKSVPITEGSGFDSFYVVTSEATVDLRWVKPDGTQVFAYHIEDPGVTELVLDRNQLHFSFNQKTASALLDNEKLIIEASQADFTVEALAKWLTEPHTLEVSDAEKKTSRIYNLDLRELRSELLTKRSISVAKMDAPFWAMQRPASFGVGMRTQFENQQSTEYIVGLAGSEYDQSYFFNGPSNHIKQAALQLRYRYGYNPFDSNWGDINYKRVTVGGQASLVYYWRQAEFDTSIDGIFSKNVQQLNGSAGIFVRWEPLQWHEWGLAFGFDPRIIRSNYSNGGDGDDPYIALTYTP